MLPTGYELRFKGVATISPNKTSKVPVAVFDISSKDEYELDRYEGFANKLYRKEIIPVTLDSGEVIECMVYILNNDRHDYMPSDYYLEIIKVGYRELGLDLKYLLRAYEMSFNSERKQSVKKYSIK
jgi:cation transport regulator ChaC